MNILDELKARGLVQATTDDEGLAKRLEEGCVSFYAGYDPTSTSLHIGNLVPTSLLARLQKAGHKPIVLVGGATGMIGDPSGRSDERSLLDAETLAANLAGIRQQLEPFVDFDDADSASNNGATVVNNADWFSGLGYIDFLREVGKHLTVNYMTAKDSVKSRLNDREQGISYTEFSYMLLQAYDFAHLAKTQECELQVGGSDQWGNITAGIELARKMGHKGKLYGLTNPLLLDSSGNKMGKTSSGTRIWLDPKRTSPYDFYQYFLRSEDSQIDKLLRLFSWRSLDEIAAIVAEHEKAPELRVGQKALAEDLTTWVHGADALAKAKVTSQVMFGDGLDQLCDADLLLTDLPFSQVTQSELDEGILLLDLMQSAALVKSKGEARRLVSGGGVYINNIRVDDTTRSVSTADLCTETMLILRCGRRKYHIVQIAS